MRVKVRKRSREYETPDSSVIYCDPAHIERDCPPLRGLYKEPIVILSGYRIEKVNRLVGGVATSQHLKGEAADCYVADAPERLLEVLRRSGLVFDQAILYKRKHFLHLSLKMTGKNWMQILTYLLSGE